MTEIVVRGPVLTGKAPAIVARFVEEMEDAVGQDALSEVQTLLDQSIRNPTPYYETQIIRQRLSEGVVVHDRGIIYGPWLEGTSSRNQTTRFKGYASFRRATQTVQGRVDQTVAPIAARMTRSLG